MDFFGLWLSSDFGHGHSKAKPKCSTYLSPMLSSSEEFVLELIEVWGVGSPTPKGDEVRKKEREGGREEREGCPASCAPYNIFT